MTNKEIMMTNILLKTNIQTITNSSIMISKLGCRQDVTIMVSLLNSYSLIPNIMIMHCTKMEMKEAIICRKSSWTSWTIRVGPSEITPTWWAHSRTNKINSKITQEGRKMMLGLSNIRCKVKIMLLIMSKVTRMRKSAAWSINSSCKMQ